MLKFSQDDDSIGSARKVFNNPTCESIECEHPQFRLAVRRVTCRRRVWWCRAITQEEAEWSLMADFIVRGGRQFLAETTSQYSPEFSKRLHKRLQNHASHLFRADFGTSWHRTVRGKVRDCTGLDLDQIVDPRSVESDPVVTAERDDICSKVRTVMAAALRPIELAVIKCRFFEGLSVSETASTLNLTQWQVCRIQTTALAKLRIVLA